MTADMHLLVLVQSSVPLIEAVLLFHQQQYEKYATLLHVVINNALALVVDILNTCKLKVTDTAMG
jgi:hypothetical protein